MARVGLVTGREPRHRGGDLEGAASGRLQGRGELRRQRRGGGQVQGRDRHPGVQVGRRRLRRLRGRDRPGRGRARAGRGPGQQCRHHPRRPVPPHEPGAVAAGDRDQPRRPVQHDPAGLGGDARPQVRPGSSTSARSTARRARPGRPTTRRPRRRHRLHQGAGAGRARLGITVNAICPGYIGTEMVRAVPEEVLKAKILPQIPVGRLGEPEEIARCVVFLPATRPASSPARRCRPTAASTWPEPQEVAPALFHHALPP